MTVYRVAAPAVYVGESTDTKPTENIAAGSIFIESDTGIRYAWCGDENKGAVTNWYAQPARGTNV